MGNITALLHDWRSGDKSAEHELVTLLYPILREQAQVQLRRTPNATLRTTELAHEAYVRLREQHGVDWQNRNHFLAISATVIRRVLVDYLRARAAEKRGGQVAVVPLQDLLDSDHPLGSDGLDWIALDQALTEFAKVEPDTARVVELRLFGGLSVEEIAEVCGSSVATVGRQWRFARAWIATTLMLPAPG